MGSSVSEGHMLRFFFNRHRDNRVGWNGSFFEREVPESQEAPILKQVSKGLLITGTSNILVIIPVRAAMIEFRTKTFNDLHLRKVRALVVQEPFNVFAKY
jgi:hypothetical protein